jgi:hypothetical protein
MIEYARQMMGKLPVYQVEISYSTRPADAAAVPVADSTKRRQSDERVSLSWRLTEREKATLHEAINEPHNRAAIKRLEAILKMRKESRRSSVVSRQ